MIISLFAIILSLKKGYYSILKIGHFYFGRIRHFHFGITFLILTGASATGSLVSVFLHNAIYALFIEWFGVGFWERIGMGDEPFFFILATIICPIAFLVGAIGSIVLFIKKKRIEIEYKDKQKSSNLTSLFLFVIL